MRTLRSVNHGLDCGHHLVVGDTGTGVIYRLFDLGAEPGVIGVGVGGQTGGHATLGDHAGQEDANGIGQGEANAVEGFGSAGLEAVIDADMEHGGLGGHLGLPCWGKCIAIERWGEGVVDGGMGPTLRLLDCPFR